MEEETTWLKRVFRVIVPLALVHTVLSLFEDGPIWGSIVYIWAGYILVSYTYPAKNGRMHLVGDIGLLVTVLLAMGLAWSIHTARCHLFALSCEPFHWFGTFSLFMPIFAMWLMCRIFGLPKTRSWRGVLNESVGIKKPE